jgi:hypothetical protein
MKKIMTASLLFLGILFLAGCGQQQVDKDPPTIPNSQNNKHQPDKLPAQTAKCGIESCHGLDITCGPNVPEACDMMYVPSDGCRQLAACQTTDGQCKLEKTPEFDSCKACVEKCAKKFPSDPAKSYDCEAGCVK